jgi:hypothetical protein
MSSLEEGASVLAAAPALRLILIGSLCCDNISYPSKNLHSSVRLLVLVDSLQQTTQNPILSELFTLGGNGL